jgi:hypothetical protein
MAHARSGCPTIRSEARRFSYTPQLLYRDIKVMIFHVTPS